MNVSEGMKNDGTNWQDDTLYGKESMPLVRLISWVILTVVGVCLVYEVVKWVSIIGIVTSAHNWYYMGMQVSLSVILLSDFVIRTKKVYFSIIWSPYTKLCKGAIVYCYILFALIYEPIVFLLVWNWSLDLILREMGDLLTVVLVVYSACTAYVAFSYQRYRKAEIEESRHKSN